MYRLYLHRYINFASWFIVLILLRRVSHILRSRFRSIYIFQSLAQFSWTYRDCFTYGLYQIQIQSDRDRVGLIELRNTEIITLITFIIFF